MESHGDVVLNPVTVMMMERDDDQGFMGVDPLAIFLEQPDDFQQENNSQVICGLCQQQFPADLLEGHLLTHITPTMVNCPQCNISCSNNEDLEAHLKTHADNRAEADDGCNGSTDPSTNIFFECTICGAHFHNTQVDKHVCNPPTVNYHYCLKCNFVCTQPKNLDDHMRSHEPETLHRCPLCDYSCGHEKLLRKHKKKEHSILCFKDTPHLSRLKPYSKIEVHNRIYQLVPIDNFVDPLDPEEDPSIEQVRNWSSSMNGGEGDVVQSSGSTADMEHFNGHTANMDNHYCRNKDKSDNLHQCDICHLRFRQRIQLKNHRRIHTGKKPYECSRCDYTARNFSGLKAHARKHSGEPHSCNICGDIFNSSQTLSIHKITHLPKH